MDFSHSVTELEAQLEDCMLADRHAVRKRLARIRTEFRGAHRGAALAALEARIAASRLRFRARRDRLPRPDFPKDLPIAAQREQIAHAIDAHQVVIVCGETGSGKTTQLPKICLSLGRGVSGLIGHTQPRRIAARSVADRIAEELSSTVGRAVGYKVRFSDQVGPDSYIKLMTDGILLQELQRDRWLNQYDTLILDEAHERNLNVDFLLGYLKRVLPKRPDLKVIVTSATIDPDSFARHFDDAPVIQVEGRSYPVEVRYRPLPDDPDSNADPQRQGVLQAIDELRRLGSGDILLFLPGEREIRETRDALRKHLPAGVEIVPLYSRLPTAEQNKIFQAHKGQRIVLATNVAETSLTVPGIRFVIDPGTARISRYSVRAKVQQLPIDNISQASAKQRMGRCGRTGPGVCIKLYSEEDLLSRPEFTTPELLRTNLAAVVLQMHHLKLGEVEDFPFLDQPDTRYVNDAYRLLQELAAMDGDRRLTRLGKKVARLPVDPKLARMLIAADQMRCLREMLVLTSALATQDPRERPLEHQQAADEKHREFEDPASDFAALLNLWEYIREQQKTLSKSALRKLCKQRFLSYARVREWQDVHRQLSQMARELDLKKNTHAADYRTVHTALLSGLLGHIGVQQEDKSFIGARNRRFHVFPGSGLFKKPPKWAVAAELTETTRLFARTVARIEPAWVEGVAQHIVKRSYAEPHWQQRAGQVGAFENVSLYGLVIVSRRRVNYGPINPKESREIFIQGALVEQRWQTQSAFYEHNASLIKDVERLEAKSRRRDILIPEHKLFTFYDEIVPTDIYSAAAFEKWYRTASKQDPQLLFLNREHLMQYNADAVSEIDFPDQLDVGGTSLPLEYCFEPGGDADGITLTVPVTVLNQVDAARCEWLVPGLLAEKIAALIKTLPKQLRRNFVPAPEFAAACYAELKTQTGSLLDALGYQLQRLTGIEVPPEAWQTDQLPEHLRVRFRVIDGNAKEIAAGRDLTSLKERLAAQVSDHFDALPPTPQERCGIKDWDFGDLPDEVEVNSGGFKLKGYPALIDEQDSVALKLMDTADKARAQNRFGVRRLFMLRLREQAKYVRKNLPEIDRSCLLYRTIGSCDALKGDLLEATFDGVFLNGQAPVTNRQIFDARLAARAELPAVANDLCATVFEVLSAHHRARQKLADGAADGRPDAIEDIQHQLQALVYPGFIQNTPAEWLLHVPRYLEAIGQRLTRLEESPHKDAELQGQIAPWMANYRKRSSGMETAANTELETFRWMLEEFRVSLFAQRLGTAMPVSATRLQKQWAEIDRQIRT